jgi:hypothetical protein
LPFGFAALTCALLHDSRLTPRAPQSTAAACDDVRHLTSPLEPPPRQHHRARRSVCRPRATSASPPSPHPKESWRNMKRRASPLLLHPLPTGSFRLPPPRWMASPRLLSCPFVGWACAANRRAAATRPASCQRCSSRCRWPSRHFSTRLAAAAADPGGGGAGRRHALRHLGDATDPATALVAVACSVQAGAPHSRDLSAASGSSKGAAAGSAPPLPPLPTASDATTPRPCRDRLWLHAS